MTSGPRSPEPGWLARLILMAYPPSFRQRYREEILGFLARQRREARYRASPLGTLRFWTEVGLDAVWNGLRARVEERVMHRRGRGKMAMGFELRSALRSLRRSPGFTATVALTLGLGIGAGTAVYGIADWLVLRPVPGVQGHDRIVTVRFQHETRADAWFLVSHPDFVDLRSRTEALDALAASHRADAHVLVPGSDVPRRLPLELVTEGYFAVMGARPVLGRSPEPAGAEDPRSVVVSHRLWRSELGADASVLGEILTVNGHPFTIAGVAPPDFHGPAPAERVTELWAPAAAHGPLIPSYPDDVLSRREHTLYFTLYGRLADAADPEVAQRELLAARETLVEQYGSATSLDGFRPVVETGVGVAPWVRERAGTTLRILLVAVGLLLLLSCANAGNLLLTRAFNRAHELSVRRALGAGRTRITAQLVTEGLVLGMLGGVVGLVVARGLLLLYHGERVVGWLPTLESVALDHRVLFFALAASLTTGVLFSLLPAILAAGSRHARPGSGTRVASGGGTLRRGLVAAQVALSLSLLVGAGLLLDTVRSLGRVDLGFDPAPVLEATLDPGTQGYGSDERNTFWRDLLDRARLLPGVDAAGLAYAPLHGRISAGASLRPEGESADAQIYTASNQVSDGFLAATGIRLVAGRDFTADEVLATPRRDVVIVTESLARELFGTPAEAAVGRRLVRPVGEEDRAFTVVGVISDIRDRTVRDDDPHLLLEPLGQVWNPTWSTLYVRSIGSPETVAGPLRSMTRELDASLPLYDVGTLSERVASSLAEERLLARLTTLFGALALLLAGLGLYGLVSYSVSARTRELGVRVALGARSRTVQAMVLRQALGLVVIGLVPGLLLAGLASRVVESRLWGVAPFDPWIYMAALTTLLGAAVLASWIPARRATRIDPVRALKVDG